MALVKICPSCGAENDINTALCDNCMADISAVSPVDTDARKTVSAPQKHADSSATVIGGAVIGREAEGREYLASHMTVSRRHAKVNFNGSWFIEDLNSSNGTYIDEKRIAPNEPHKVKSGDIVALSHSCIFTVKEQ